MMHRRNSGPTRRAVMAGLAATLLAAPAATQQTGGRSAQLVPGKRMLVQRVIVQRGAQLMGQPGEPAGIAQPPLRVFYVYGRRSTTDGREWLEVGRAPSGAPDGWIRADRAVPWDHNLALAYAPRAGRRDRVLYFRTRDEVRDILRAPNREERVRGLYAQVSAGAPGPVVAHEPAGPLDGPARFHLLPLLGAERVSLPNLTTVTLVEVVAIAASDQAPFVAPQPETGPPPVTRAWTAAVDLLRPDVATFEVGVLATRQQLADLADVVRTAMAEARVNNLRPADFFDRLRRASAAMVRDPARLRSAQLVSSADAQELVEGLPYQTRFTEITTEEWLALGAAIRSEQIGAIARMLAAYADIAQRREAWFSPSGSSAGADDLTLLPLDLLP